MHSQCSEEVLAPVSIFALTVNAPGWMVTFSTHPRISFAVAGTHTSTTANSIAVACTHKLRLIMDNLPAGPSAHGMLTSALNVRQ